MRGWLAAAGLALGLQLGLSLLQPAPEGTYLLPTRPSGARIEKRQTELFLAQQGQASADVRWVEVGRSPGPLPLTRDELPADFRLSLPGYRAQTVHVDAFPLPGPVGLDPRIPVLVPAAYLVRDFPGAGLALALVLAGLIQRRLGARRQQAVEGRERRQRAGAFQPGDPVGPYVLGELLGQGASGQVFACGADKAIKLYFQRGSTPEVQALRKLRHPHLLHLYDWGEHEGTEYVVMERVHGLPLEGADVRRMGRELLAAVSELHRVGLVHRDVKPANLMRTERGVILMDFSLASAEPRAERVGTPGFMAPEQIRGEKADARSDLYAVGATLAALLGQPAFPAPTPLAVMDRQLRGDRAPVPDLDELIGALLEVEPSRRPTAEQAAARLGQNSSG